MKLNFKERICLNALLNSFKGQITGLYKILEIIKQIEITPKEMKEAEVKVSGTQISWNIKKEKEKGIQLDETQIGIIKNLLENKNALQDFRQQDIPLLELAEKLGIKLSESEMPKLPKTDIPPDKKAMA